MIATLPQTTQPLLSDDLLQRCAQRAAMYDRENRFCQEDFDELKAAGYLRLTVPPEFGGKGLTLAEMSRETRRLAYHAPATAVCLNMHHYWVGLAADLSSSGRSRKLCRSNVTRNVSVVTKVRGAPGRGDRGPLAIRSL